MGKPHAVVIPYPAQGHVIPLMELSHCLVNHGFKISFINTEFNHKRVLDSLSSASHGDDHHTECPIHLISIPDGLETEEDRNDFGKASAAILALMPAKLEEIIRKMNEEAAKEDGDVVTCVVADLNMGWALQVAKRMGIRGAAFYPASAVLLAQSLLVPGLMEEGILDEEGTPTRSHIIQLSPNMPTMDIENLAWNCIGTDPTLKKIIFKSVYHNSKIGQSLDWIICNSAFELESATFTLFPKILPIGPLLASSRLGRTSGHFWPENSTCLNWLDQQPPRSVIYVAFGSFTIFEQVQFQELASGLELSGKHFLWVVRPDSSHPYPNGFQTRISTRGQIVGWAPQQNVLSHPSVACFFSHCGWNSTMEGVSNGIPFLCWPYLGDQFLNQDYICDIWKIGLRLKKNENGIISRKEIMEKVKQVTEDEGIRTRVLRLMEMARESVKDGGSSSTNFKDFVERINSLVLIFSKELWAGKRYPLVTIPDGLGPEEDWIDLVKLSILIRAVITGKLEENIRKINAAEEDDELTCLIADGTMGCALNIVTKSSVSQHQSDSWPWQFPFRSLSPTESLILIQFH